MKSRKHLVSRILFTMLATDESNGVALNPGSISQPSQIGGGGLGGPGILGVGTTKNNRGHFPLEEAADQSLEEGEEYDDEHELEEDPDPDDLLDKHMKLLDSDVIPYHKKPGFCMSLSSHTVAPHHPHTYTHCQ